MKKVLFIAGFFPPRNSMGSQRNMKFAKYLPEFGYDPLVLTRAEKDIDFALDNSLLEEIPKTTIFRCRSPERHIVAILNNLKLKPLCRLFCGLDTYTMTWQPGARRTALRLSKQYSIELIYTSVSPYSDVLLGYKLKKRLGGPWVVDYRDPWTDNITIVWPTRLHYLWECRQEGKALQFADAIVVVTPTMKTLLARRYPSLAKRIHVIPNGYDPPDYSELPAGSPGDALRIGFTGSMGDYSDSLGAMTSAPKRLWLSTFGYSCGSIDRSTRSPYYLLRAVRALLDEHPDLRSAIQLSFAGVFGEKNLELVHQLSLQDVVEVRGILPHRDALQLQADSDVLFLPMESNTNGERSFNLSGKVFEYLAAGKPVLAAVPEGDLADLIEDSNAGWRVDPYDESAIKQLLLRLIGEKKAENLYRRASPEFLRRFERRRLTGQLASLFDELLGSR